MCTFNSDRQVRVCDVAIGHVKTKLIAGLGDAIQYTHLEGEGTLIDAGVAVNAGHFRQLVNAGIAEAEHASAQPGEQPEARRP